MFELTCVATGPSRSSNRVSGAEQVDGCEEEEAPRGNHVAFVGRESHHTRELFKAGPAIGWLFKICFGIAQRNLAALAQQLRLYWESLSNQLLQHQANSHVFLVIFFGLPTAAPMSHHTADANHGRFPGKLQAGEGD